MKMWANERWLDPAGDVVGLLGLESPDRFKVAAA